MTYILRVYDPRQEGIAEVTFDGQVLPLISAGSWCETPEFRCLPLNIPDGAQIPPYQIVWLDDGDIDWAYNPGGRTKGVLDTKRFNAQDKAAVKGMREVVNDMERTAHTQERSAWKWMRGCGRPSMGRAAGAPASWL